MNFVTYLIVIISIIYTVNGLSCYNCISKNSKECINPLAHDDFKPQPCNMDQINVLANKTKEIAQQLGSAFGIDIAPAKTDLNVPLACQKIVTTVGRERVIIRSCQVATGGDSSFCDSMKGKVTDNVITYCSLCDTDGCNAGNFINPVTMLSAILPVALFMILS